MDKVKEYKRGPYQRRLSSYDTQVSLVIPAELHKKISIACKPHKLSKYLRANFEHIATDKVDITLLNELSNPIYYAKDGENKTKKINVRYFLVKKEMIQTNANKLGRDIQDFVRAYFQILTKNIQIPVKTKPNK